MKKCASLVMAVSLLGVTATGSVAADADGEVVPVPAHQQTLARVTERLRQVFSNQPDSIADAPLAGFFEVAYGTQLFYVSADAKHLISGDVYDLKTMDNLTERRRASDRLTLLGQVPESSVIVYKAKDEKHVINVFTDIDCVYCRKLHSQVTQYNDLGITVRYLAFPRAGIDSPSYEKAVSVWCADDRNKAMDAAKGSGKIDARKCDAPVAQQWALGKRLGISGTPGLILQSGELLPGYVPPERLLTMLEQ